MTTAPSTVTADEIALHFGVTTRTVIRWIHEGLPARKAGHPRRWMVRLDLAGPWVTANAPRAIGPPITGLRQAIEATAGRNGAAPAGGDVDHDGELDGTVRHIDRLDGILEAFTDLLCNANEFDPRLVVSVKAISTELRRLEVHRLEMRKADSELMDRSDHVRVLGTFARLVVDEIEAWARSTPDHVVDCLTAAGVKTNGKRVLKMLDAELQDRASELRTRIADGVERAEDLE